MDQQIVPIDVIFDSRSTRQQATGSQLNRDCPVFQIDGLSNMVGMSIMWANIPFTFYTIDQLNNTFYIQFSTAHGTPVPPTAGAIPWTAIVIRPGTYSPIGFQQEFRRALKALGTLPAPAPPIEPSKWFCLISSHDMRLQIYNNENHYFKLKVDNTILAEIMGFIPGQIEDNGIEDIYVEGEVRAQGGFVIKGRRVVKFISTPRLNLHSNLSAYQNNVRNDPDAPSDCILQVPIIGAPGAYMYYQPNPAQIPITRATLYTVSFYLTQGSRENYCLTNGDIVQYLPLNGEGFQVCIRFFQDNGVVRAGESKSYKMS